MSTPANAPSRRDLEYGRTALSKKWDDLNISPGQVFVFLLSLFVTILAVYIKIEVHEMVNPNVITTEGTFRVFEFSEKISRTEMQLVEFPIFKHKANIVLQKNNLFHLAEHARKYLNDTESVCIHAKYFEAPHDIIITHDLILVDPIYTPMSAKKKFTKVSDPFGKEKEISYPEICEIQYLDGDSLEMKTQQFKGLDALCFFFYVHNKD